MASLARYRSFSPARIWAIAASTVTQLLRMRIMIFLAVFCLLVAFTAFAFPTLDPEQQLKQCKAWSLGALQFFAFIIAIMATALLLPRDVEDRTLYTILAKPVPRHDYLIGKLIGVLLLIAVGLVVMDVLFAGILYLRQTMILRDWTAALNAQYYKGVPPEVIADITSKVQEQGLTWSLHLGVVTIFLKASVLAALSLLISCFASSTLFTVISALCMAILGHGEAMLRDYFFAGDGLTWVEKFMSMTLAVLVPDLRLFDAVDSVIAGKVLSLASIGWMSGIAALYVVGYLTVAHLIFGEKEL